MSIRDTTLPAGGASWLGWGKAVDDSLRAMVEGGFHLDEFTGTDDQKLTAAIAAQQAATDRNMPAIVLPSRPLNFNIPRTLYSGCKVIGSRPAGQKNPELASGQYVGPEVVLGGSIGSGTASWWNGTGSIYDVFMADFSVQGSSGSSVHQFLDQNSGTLYACEFRSLSFNFMRGVFGIKTRTCYFTQVNLTGVWTINNLWDMQIHVGGSDNSLWQTGYVNIGPSSSAAQTGTYADSDYQIYLENTSNTVIGYVYLSALNGWRGLRVGGTQGTNTFLGGVYEGYKPSRVNGLLSGPAPGTVIRLDSGTGVFFGTFIGQGMDSPDAAENGLIQVNGGEWAFYSPSFHGLNMATANAIQHVGGRLLVMGATWRASLGYTGRPRVKTTATAGAGSTSFYSPDQSVTVV